MWTQRHACLGCIEDLCLRDQVESSPSLKLAACFYCGSQRVGITLEELALRCGTAIDGSFRELDTATPGDGDPQPPTYTMAAVIRAVLPGRPELLSDIEALLYTAWSADDCYNPVFVLGPDLGLKGAYQMALSDAGAEPGRPFHELVALVMDSQSHGEHCFFHHVGPGCLIQSLYTARVFPSIEAVESALAGPENAMLPGNEKHSDHTLQNFAWMFSASTEASLAMADARPWMGSYVVTAEIEIQEPIALLDLRRASLMPTNVEESYFSPKQIQRGQQAAFFRKLQQALNAERHVRDLERSPGVGFQAISRLAACFRPGHPNVCGLLLPPASTRAQWWEEPGCTVLLWDGLRPRNESTGNGPTDKQSMDNDSADDRRNEVGGRTGNGSTRLDWQIQADGGRSVRDFLRVRRVNFSVHHIGRVDICSTEVVYEHSALRNSRGH